MVYLAKQKKGKNTYYYLVGVIQISKKQRKQIRKYIGTKKPSETKKQVLMAKFEKEVEKEKIKLHGFHYLLSDEINEINKINKEFLQRYKKHNKTVQKQFDQNFAMTFVYNSNSIEGSTLTPKEVELLLNEHISPNKPLEDVLEAKSAEKVINFIKKFSGDLNEQFLLQVHKIYFKETMPHLAGKYKTAQNRITGSAFETTSPKFVLTDMKLYFEEYNKLKKELHPLELAAWAHWKLVRIHPFQDGNGRTARIIMNFILNKNNYAMIDIKTKERQQYIKALEKCNYNNNARNLTTRLVRRFKKQYKNALKDE